MKKVSLLTVLLLYVTCGIMAQQGANTPQQKAGYMQMINERSHKIIASLNINDSVKFYKVQQVVADQYRNLNDIYSKRDYNIALVKKSSSSKDSISAAVKSIEEKIIPSIDSLHTLYITKLSALLSSQQVTAIKDGMTYSVLPITYKAYLDMLPDLTSAQKDQIMKWLIEAREHSMDAESSEKKHAWFGKYKGRINNYLSTSGYDLKKAGEDWEKRRNAAKTVSGN